MMPPEPTVEQVKNNAAITWQQGDTLCQGMACWYPQMGGYSGKAVVMPLPTADGARCYEVYVWHDGEFPFRGEGGVNPVVLHHCSAEQFISFGQFLMGLP